MSNIDLQSETKDTIVEVIAIPAAPTQKKSYYETAERLKRLRDRYPHLKLKKMPQLAREKLASLAEEVNAELDAMEKQIEQDKLEGKQAG